MGAPRYGQSGQGRHRPGAAGVQLQWRRDRLGGGGDCSREPTQFGGSPMAALSPPMVQKGPLRPEQRPIGVPVRLRFAECPGQANTTHPEELARPVRMPGNDGTVSFSPLGGPKMHTLPGTRKGPPEARQTLECSAWPPVTLQPPRPEVRGFERNSPKIPRKTVWTGGNVRNCDSDTHHGRGCK